MQKRSADVVVIGAGVAGLAAAGEVGRRGLRVLLLEARDRVGGRVFTVRQKGWPDPVELGAQFVHAGNDALWSLLKRHGLETRRVPPRHWHLGANGLAQIDDVTQRIANVTKQISERKMKGWTVAEFLAEKGHAFRALDRELAVGFVEGFEAALCDEMSATAVAGETLEDDEQFTVVGGYERVVAALYDELPKNRVSIRLQTPCTAVEWRRGSVLVRSPRGEFRGVAAIVTVPLGVLQARGSQRGAIAFAPRLRAHEAVLAKMRMGQVIRLTLRFDARPWTRFVPPTMRDTNRTGFGFVHTRLAGVPVWWSLTSAPVVTGWAGGPDALALAGRSAGGIENIALTALSKVLGVQKNRLKAAVKAVATHNWSRDPFSRGAYSFAAAGAEDASEKLRQPVQRTLFFAGEATADGEEVGTVHGALGSGLRAADEVATVLGAQA